MPPATSPSSWSPGARGSRRSRPACRATASGGCRACAARRSPRWPASAPTTTGAWSAARSAASPSSCWRRSPGPCSSTRPSTRTSSTWPGPRARSPRSARARPASASDRSCSASSTSSRRRRSSATTTATTWLPTRSAARCTRRCSTVPSSPPTARASPSWTPLPRTSSPSGSGWRRISSRRCAPRPGATPTTAACRTSSASCRRAATRSACAGRRTTCASTGRAPSAYGIPSSASWSSATRR